MRSAIAIVGIVLAVIGAIGVRIVIEGRRALADGDAALAAKRPVDAIAAWETAARWYLPGAPHVDAAYARLVGVATSDPTHALFAWRAVRRAANTTRSLWTPHAADRAAADAAIAKLLAGSPEAAAAAGQNAADRAAFFAARLAADPRPGTASAALAIVGILSWLAGIGVIVRRGVAPAGGLVRRPALVGAVLTVVGVAAWAVGLYNA